ncbi:MAG: nucleotidyltransferase domain-containing protein [Candidatus Jordarchaeum sp.]|uniref:nucleotidyltransferase domain-containing protein n=1 Tax=Candidatus Jordarchaeum sp. TaxID=2823881 RepID=UPI00404AE8E1
MKKKVFKLFTLTPEGRIIQALSNGEKSFSELFRETDLSERWLSIKLKQLLQLGVVKISGNGYQIDWDKLHTILSASLKEIAWIAAYEIVEKHPEVLGVLLYGSVAKGKTGEESDIDLLVISENPLSLADEEYQISIKYGVAFEINSITLKEFIALLNMESSLIFGILEGYQVLFDNAGIAQILKVFKKEIYKNWSYNPDEEIWVKLEK